MRWFLLMCVAAFPSASFAQEWVVVTDMDLPAAVAPTQRGNVIGFQNDVPEVAWLNSEIVTLDNTEPRDCNTNTNLQLNHYYGVDGIYTVDVFANLMRSETGIWALEELEVYVDWIDPESTYLSTDPSINLGVFDCRGTAAFLSLTFKAKPQLVKGIGPDEIDISGAAVMTLPIQRFSPI